MMRCAVRLLDDTDFAMEIDKIATGHVLLEKIFERLDILEKDYFSLSYLEKIQGTSDGQEAVRFWLNMDRKISKQVKPNASGKYQLEFLVKFYPPNPIQLHEDITRYQLCLQVRRDIASGLLPCSFVTAALLGAYTVQSEVGDYSSEEHGSGIKYIEDFNFVPNQTEELLEKIVELHKTLKGMMPSEAELKFLDNAKKLALYGVDLHAATDSAGSSVTLGVCSTGLLVYRDGLRIIRFSWIKILRISYRRDKFTVHLRGKEFDQIENDMVEYTLPNPELSKRLWKTAVEHHAFFRLREPESAPKIPFMPHLDSKFRYSGQTHYQVRQNSARIERPPPVFDRIARSSLQMKGSRSMEVDRSNRTSAGSSRAGTLNLKKSTSSALTYGYNQAQTKEGAKSGQTAMKTTITTTTTITKRSTKTTCAENDALVDAIKSITNNMNPNLTVDSIEIKNREEADPAS